MGQQMLGRALLSYPDPYLSAVIATNFRTIENLNTLSLMRALGAKVSLTKAAAVKKKGCC